jgi:LysR family hydrogen peroxide-inducible transcriptional activator
MRDKFTGRGVMQIRDIKYVAAIAETGNFSHAAEQLYISQPALSRLVQRLEDELGVRLFIREHNTVTLTYAGRVFLEDGQTILTLSSQIRKKMCDIQKLDRGELTVSASPFYQKFFLTRILPEFHRLYPGITTHIVDAFASDQENWLQKGSVDVAIIPSPSDLPNIQTELLFLDYLLLAAPSTHPIRAMLEQKSPDGLTLADLSLLKDENFIMYKQGRRLRDFCLKLCREAGFGPHIVLETHSCENLFALVVQGMGLGFVPMATPDFFPPENRLTCFRINDPRAVRKVVIACRDGYLSAAAKEFIRICKKKVKEILLEITYKSPAP